MEQVRVIIEVRGGNVGAVYAGSFVEAVVIDHDVATVYEVATEPETACDPWDYRGYEGGFPEHWTISCPITPDVEQPA
ncbi:hypothetical protein LMG28614_05668 [Paraburkholderia ultramafica]|uniref:Uncharacterized protein n=1 Tax=Paraburkholderia ultramafica TaxID=1544867 RepID=A0A6S7BK85_9BURK|nr:hypothetical protein [Paraburkholderia ultramafica]CAB3802659.1 hypothetical protein LMG28614_05668 [Paraburkholderia ultramafica]